MKTFTNCGFTYFLEKPFADTKKKLTFALVKQQTLPYGVMVAHRILVPLVRVRILLRQQKSKPLVF